MKMTPILLSAACAASLLGQGVAMKSYSQISASEPKAVPATTDSHPLTLADLQGKTIWFVPNPKRTPASKRAGFSKTPTASLDEMVYPDSTVSLKVLFVNTDGTHNTLQVSFPDGSVFFMHCDAASLVNTVKVESVSPDVITAKEIPYYNYKLRPMNTLDASDQEAIFTTDPAVLRAKLEEVRKASQEAALQDAEDGQEESRARNAAREKAISRQPAELRNVIRSHKIKLGMTPEQVTLAWGRPQDINRTTTLGGTREQWVYGIKSYVYFQGGVVTAIQN